MEHVERLQDECNNDQDLQNILKSGDFPEIITRRRGLNAESRDKRNKR